MATPTLVQDCYFSAAGEAGNAFKIPFANTTLANNFLCLIMTYTDPSTISSVTDSNSVSWTAGVTAGVGSGAYATVMYFLAGAAATSSVTVTFSASPAEFHPELMEFYNVATSSPADGSHGSAAASSPTVQPGSFTPTTSGDLIICSCMDLSEGSGNLGVGSRPTAIAAGTGTNTTFSLAAADRRLGGATEYGTQTSAAAINPSISITQGVADGFNCIAAAFKSASAGTAPSANAYVAHMYHIHLDSGSVTYQFPTVGNLLVMAADIPNNNGGGSIITVTTASPSNTMTKYSPSTTNPQGFYSVPASSGLGMSGTVTNGNSGNSVIMCMWDVVCIGTPAHDTDASTGTQTQSSAGADLTNTPSITPTLQPGVAFEVIQCTNGPTSGSIGAGFFYDNVSYTGEDDSGTLNEGNGRQHKFYSSTTAQAFGYHMNNSPATNWSAVAMAFSTPTPSSGPVFEDDSFNPGSRAFLVQPFEPTISVW